MIILVKLADFLQYSGHLNICSAVLKYWQLTFLTKKRIKSRNNVMQTQHYWFLPVSEVWLIGKKSGLVWLG